MSLKIRRGLEADRILITPSVGEFLYTIDTKQVYIGDGSTPGGNSLTATTDWGDITGTITAQTDLTLYLSTNYYPIPTGTTSQYIRGDGTLATFPTIQTVTPSALTKTNDTNITLTLGGTPATSLLQAVSLTLGWTGTLADSRIASASTWNAKQNALSGTGFVKIFGTTISYDNSIYYLASNPSGYITSSALTPYLTTADAALTYFPIPTGTTSQYIRGDGSLSTLPSLTGYVPYTGATANVDLGINNLTANSVNSTLFQLNSNYKLEFSAYGFVTLTNNSKVWQFNIGGDLQVPGDVINGTYGGNRVSLASGAHLQSLRDGFIELNVGTGGTETARITLTDTGALGIGTTPNYGTTGQVLTSSGIGGLVYWSTLPTIPTVGTWGTLNYPTWTTGTPFVKMTAAGTFALDTNTYYLVSNPSGYTSNLGTVTSVTALNLGTSGNDLNSTVSNNSTTPVITLNVPDASAINRGVLNSGDWTIFNNKQNKLTLTTIGSTGVATLVNSVLNIPNYVGGSTDISWFTLVSGYNTIIDLPSITTGDVMQYTYLGGAVYYRFIANDDSEDSFYANYISGDFTTLIATKKLTII